MNLPLPDARTSAPDRRARRRGIRVRLAAVLVAGGTLTATAGLAMPAAAATAPTAQAVDWSSGRDGTGSAWASGRSGSGSRVDSEPASTAESRSVALVDTVLPTGEAAGTGIVLTSDGEVLTNYHVVEGSTSIRVTIAGTGRAYTAEVVGADKGTDVALLQLEDASGLAVATIDDDTLAVGDDVTAVGNAGGTGELTAADGDVTALSASITTASEGSVEGERLTSMIETDADVVAGDSGGPLLDDEGEVVGIDTAASSGAEIDGYAIPIAVALGVVAQVRAGDESADVRIGPAAFLGIEVASGSADDAGYGAGASSRSTSGAAVTSVVEGGAAAAAGIGAGDTVTRIGSTTIGDAADLTEALGTLDPGDRVAVTWTTVDGATRTATVTLGSSPVN